MKIVMGDICYPKTNTIIIPANSLGTMSSGVQRRVAKDSLNTVIKEVKIFITKNKVEIGDCFITGSGRLKRRGVKNICHVVIKRLQSDFTSVYIVEKALNKAFKTIISEKLGSVSICGIGTETGDLDRKSIARIIIDTCKKYKDKVEIKIIDDNKEFIKECINFAKDIGIYEKE